MMTSKPTQTIQIIFAISDFFALLIAVFYIFTAVAIHFAVPVYLKMHGEQVSFTFLLTMSLLIGAMAVGYYSISKRRIEGFIVVLISMIGYALLSGSAFPILLNTLLLLLIGIPWFLVIINAESQ